MTTSTFDALWQPLPVCADPRLRRWLLDRGSLTLRIQLRCDDFRLDLLSQHIAAVERGERAILGVREIRRLHVFDKQRERADAFAADNAAELKIPVNPVDGLGRTVPQCDVVITCTTSQKFFITREMVRPGTFIAAVGADSEDKQEIDPSLLACATVVTDITEQACAIGDSHHAIAGNYMLRTAIHAELGEIVTGKKRARIDEDQIIVFDSTGTGLEDVAAAVTAYRLACGRELRLPPPL